MEKRGLMPVATGGYQPLQKWTALLPRTVHSTPLSWASKLGIQKKRIVEHFFYIGNFKDHHYAVRKECTEKFVGIFEEQLIC